jgi:5-methylcytosine-specific restriction endonuclease McrA
MTWKKVVLTCPVCGYTRESTNPDHPYCQRCAGRKRTWSDEGARKLLKLASRDGRISAIERDDFIEKYHRTHKVTACTKSSFKKSLISLGYNGKFGRHHKSNILQTANRHYKEKHDGEGCRVCGYMDDLEVHHIVPLNWGGLMDDENNMELLCKHCHQKEHSRIRKIIRSRYGSVRNLRNLWLSDRSAEFRELIGRS